MITVRSTSDEPPPVLKVGVGVQPASTVRLLSRSNCSDYYRIREVEALRYHFGCKPHSGLRYSPNISTHVKVNSS